MDEKSNGGTAPETTVEEENAICKNGSKFCGKPANDFFKCWDCRTEEREKIEQEREKIDRRHLEHLREVGIPKRGQSQDDCGNYLAPPKGAISDAILEEMGIYACKGYSVGNGCSAERHRCENRSILWLNYEKDLKKGCLARGSILYANDGQCEACRKKDTYKWDGGCGLRHCSSCGF